MQEEEDARKVFNSLLRNPKRNIKRAAQQMLYQEQAQSFLKVEDQGSANEEFAKIARGGLERSLGVATNRRCARFASMSMYLH